MSQNKVKFEECVLCHCKTDVPTNTPVAFRKNYVVGVGELCDKCYLEVYVKVDPYNNRSENPFKLI